MRPFSRSFLALALLSLCLAPQLASAQVSDVTAPELVDFSFSPSTIDVSPGPVTVMATLQLTDDLSGASFARVTFRSPSFQSQFLGAVLTTGTRLNGTFEGDLTFPQFSENGTWTVSGVSLFDLAGNSAFIDTTTLMAGGFPTELTVVSDPSDTNSPTVSSIGISPSPVDVSSGSQSLMMALGLEDDLSGVVFAPGPTGSFFNFFAAEIRSPSGAQSRFVSNRAFTLDPAGTPQSGTWDASLEMPQFSEPGIWQIASIRLRDIAANQSFINTAALQALGLPTELEVISVLSDTLPPELINFVFSPLLIDTSTSFQQVTVTMRIVDDLAGTDFSPDTPTNSFFFGVGFRSPSGGQFRSAAFSFNLIQGDALDGVWEISVFFPQFSEAGTWRVTNVIVKDATRNITSLVTDDLAVLGFPTRLVVIQPSLMGDGTIGDPAAGGTVMDDVFEDRAQVTFPPGVLSQPTDVAIDVFQDPLDVPIPAGFQAAGTRFVNIDLDPQPVFPLPPPGLTLVLPLVDPLPVGRMLDLFRIEPATGNLVPALDVVTGLPVVGQVDAGGLSATFTGIASLSVVVGLLPDVITVDIDIKPGSDLNPINLTSKGVIPVAILTTEAFDATSIDPSTTMFGPDGATEAHGKGHIEDADYDGDLDLVLHFKTQDTGISCGASAAFLTGATFDGQAIEGSDSIDIVRC